MEADHPQLPQTKAERKLVVNIKETDSTSKVCGNVINAAGGKGVGIFDFANKYNSGDAKAGGGGNSGGIIVEGNTINADNGEGVGIGKFHNVYYNWKKEEETSSSSKGEVSGSSKEEDKKVGQPRSVYKKKAGCGCFGIHR